MIMAAGGGQKEIVELLLESNADVNLKENDGSTALMVAALFGYKEIVELLLQNNAIVNAKKTDGSTALIFAAREGHKEIVEILLQENANVNAKVGWPKNLGSSGIWISKNHVSHNIFFHHLGQKHNKKPKK